MAHRFEGRQFGIILTGALAAASSFAGGRGIEADSRARVADPSVAAPTLSSGPETRGVPPRNFVEVPPSVPLWVAQMSGEEIWDMRSQGTDLVPNPQDNVFGIKDGVDVWLSPAQFRPDDGVSHLIHDSFNYFHSDTVGSTPWAALVPLHNGLLLTDVRLYMYDADLGLDVGAFGIDRYDGGEAAVPTTTAIFAVNGPIGFSGGYTTVDQALSHTIDLRDTTKGQMYVVYVTLPGSVDIRFRGVRLTYKWQRSPSPALASFTDVLVTHPNFQSIEAFAGINGSGISTGCTATKYCPSSFVTREQAAVFFARALGLHFGL